MRHLTEAELVAWPSADMEGADWLALSDHLQECSICRAALAAASQAEGRLDQALQGHLEYGALAGYVDGTATSAERAKVDSHCAECDSCAAELADLADFGRQLRAQPVPLPQRRPRWLMPAAIAATVLLAVGLLWMRQMGRAETEWVVRIHETGGVEVGLDSHGQLRAPDGWSQDDRRLLQAALEKGRFELGSVPHSKPGVLMGAPGSARFALLAPLGVVVRSTRPLLRWQPCAGATAYRVEIYDEEFQRLAGSPPLTDPVWQVAVELQRGKTYLWQVTASLPGGSVRAPMPPEAEARFSVVDAAAEALIAAAENRSPQSRLLLAARLAQAGLRDEARQTLAPLASDNAAQPRLHALLRSLDKRP